MAFTLCQYGQVAHGAGQHAILVAERNPSDPVESQKWAFAAQIILFPALACPKLSICLAYLRIFDDSESRMGRRIIQCLMFLILVQALPYFFINLLQCKPISAYWTEGRPASKCHMPAGGLYVHGGTNVLVDIVLMVIVLPRVLELHISKRQKGLLLIVVGLGAIAATAGIIRMVRVTLVFLNPNFDASWDAYDLSIWTSTEVYVSLICAAAPGMKPVILRLLPRFLGTVNSRPYDRTVDQHSSIELRSRLRRVTIGSARTRRKPSDTILDDGDGLYATLGRGADRDSMNYTISVDVDGPEVKGSHVQVLKGVL